MVKFLKNRSIRTKLVVGYSTAFLLVTGVVGLLVFNVVFRSMENDLTAELRDANTTMKAMVEGAIDLAVQTHLKREADMGLDRVEFCYQQYRRGFLTEAEARGKARDFLLGSSIGISGYTYCLDTDGVVQVHPDAEMVGRDVSDEPHVQRQVAARSGYLEYEWYDPDAQLGRPRALYMDYFEEWDWIVSASAFRAEFVDLLDLDVFGDMILDSHFGDTGYSCVVDTEGRVVFHPRLVGNIANLEDNRGTRYIEAICDEKQGQLEFFMRDEAGDEHRMIAVYDYIPAAGWIVASAHNPDEVYAPMREMRATLGIGVAVGLAAFLLLSTMLGNSLTWRLGALQHAFREGAAGDYSVRLASWAADEIGELGDYFNTFMTQLEANHEFLRQEVRERRQAEAQARKNEGRFRTFLNTAKEGCVEMDTRGRIRDFNPEFAAMLGRDRGELVGMSVFELAPGLGDKKQARRLLKSPVPIEVSVRRPDDSVVHVLVNAAGINDETGERVAIFAMMTDVTDQRRQTNQLRMTQFTLDSAVVPVFWVGRDARLLYANDAACSVLGYSRVELLGMSIGEIDAGFDADRWKEISEAVLNKGHLHDETELRTRGGEDLPVDLVLNHIRFDNYDYICGFAIDISDRKLADSQQQRLNEELEQRVDERTSELRHSLSVVRETQEQLVESEKMAALGNLVAGVAHEINTPVGISVTAASHLRDRAIHYGHLYAMNELKKSDLESFWSLSDESTEIILANLTRAAEMIASFKQVAVDQSSLERRRFDLKWYIAEVIKSLRPRWKKTAHVLELTGDDGVELDSYPGIFSQIVTNLTMNTLTHGFDGIEAGRIEIDVARDGDNAVLTYSDDGCGIERSHMKKLFDPFFTTKRGNGGSGLGLHIIYNLVNQKLGGSIGCESSPGNGTTFTIRIPLVKEPEHVEAREEQPA